VELLSIPICVHDRHLLDCAFDNPNTFCQAAFRSLFQPRFCCRQTSVVIGLLVAFGSLLGGDCLARRLACWLVVLLSGVASVSTPGKKQADHGRHADTPVTSPHPFMVAR